MSGTDGSRHADEDARRESTHDSGSSNVAEDEEDEVPLEDERDKKPGKMSIYRKRDVIFFIFGLTFSTLAALYTSPRRISKTPPAKPFFNQSSIVLDFYKGHLGAMVDRVTSSDFSFIMFYAPWDAECQAARDEFEIVAKYYHTQIFFAAINCWHPGSDCRTHYNKIQSYPVFMMYPPRDSGVQYRGILSAPYMIHFLSNFLNPIERITHEDDFMQLLVKHNSVMVGIFKFNGLRDSPGYKEFYKTAIRHLEKDPNRDVAFAVATSATIEEIYNKRNETIRYPSAVLLTTNGTVKYPEHKDWTSENLLNWISKVQVKSVLWLQPPGVKSTILSNFLLSGPVLFLFTPRNILLTENHNYDLLNYVGLMYHNCDNNPVRTRVLMNLNVKITRAEEVFKERIQFCTKLFSRDTFQEAPFISTTLQHWINDSCCSNIVMNKCPICEKVDESSPQVCTVDSKIGQVCKDSDILYTTMNAKKQGKYEYCCPRNFETRKEDEKMTSYRKYDENVDPLSSASVKQHQEKESCRRFLAGNEFLAPKFYEGENENVSLSNARCFSNKTLWFVAIDSVTYYHFADVFGMNLMKRPDKTAVIIVDSDVSVIFSEIYQRSKNKFLSAEQESQYIMQKKLTRGNLVEFINDFVGGWLKRNLRSESSKSSHGRKLRKCDDSGNESRVCVTELTTKTFLPTVLNPSQDVIVFYHTPYCAFCSAVGYVFLTVAHYLRQMDHVKFVRIDGDNNDLPWEYTMSRYPSILFFPAKRKEDSTVFPFNLPVSISNLVNFVLANLEGDAHVEALINICHAGAGESPCDCVRRIRLLCLDLVQEHLLVYRKLRRQMSSINQQNTVRQRRRLLVQLEHTRDIHLILGSVENLQKDTRQVTLMRTKFKSYYNTLRNIDKKFIKREVKGTKKQHLTDQL